METLGQRIRRLREERRWSQQALGDMLEVSGRTVGNWERGAHLPKNSMGALESIFGVSLDDGRPLADNDVVVRAIEGTELSRADKSELISHYWRLLDASRDRRGAAG